MKGIQVIGILVAMYLILQTLIQYKKGNYGLKRTCFWLALWGLIGSLFAFPSLVGLTLPFFAMQDMVLTTLVVGVIVVFVLVYHTYQQVTRVERKLTELVQNIAIQDYIKNATADPKGKDDER
jgi:hypothetical protein